MDNQNKSSVSTARSDNRRRHTIVPNTFHTRYVLVTTGFVALLAIISFADFFSTFRQAVITRQAPQELFALLDKQVLLFCLRILLYALSVCFFLFVLLHRIAGPVYRLRKSTQVIASGDLTHRTQLRKRDSLKELEGDFNEMTAALQEKVNEAKTAVGTVRKSLEALESSRDLPAPVKDKLTESISLLSGAFKTFKT